MTALFSLVSIALFAGGVYLLLTKRNAVLALMGVELILNASALNLAGWGALHGKGAEAQLAVLFVMVVAAANAAVALALVLRAYARYGTVDLFRIRELREGED